MISNSTPYFYIIRHKRTGKLYAGCKYGKGSDPNKLLKKNGYNTSSSLVKSIIKNEGLDSFTIEDIFTEDDLNIPFGCSSVMEYESWFLRENNCARNSQFMNKTNNTPYGGDIHVSGKSTYYNHSGEKIFMDVLEAESLGYRSIKTGTVSVRNSNGDCFRVSANDPKLISGEYVGVAKGIKVTRKPQRGKINCVDKNGNTHKVPKTDPRIKSGELVVWSAGKVTVVDSKGNTFQTLKTDPRFISGELKSSSAGRIWIHYPPTKESRMVYPNDNIPEGWVKGSGRFKK